MAASAALFTKAPPPPSGSPAARPATGRISDDHSSGARLRAVISEREHQRVDAHPRLEIHVVAHVALVVVRARLLRRLLHDRTNRAVAAVASPSTLAEKLAEDVASNAARMDARRTAPSVPYACNRSTTVLASSVRVRRDALLADPSGAPPPRRKLMRLSGSTVRRLDRNDRAPGESGRCSTGVSGLPRRTLRSNPCLVGARRSRMWRPNPRRAARREEHVRHHARGPRVHFEIVGSAARHLGAEVGVRAARTVR